MVQPSLLNSLSNMIKTFANSCRPKMTLAILSMVLQHSTRYCCSDRYIYRSWKDDQVQERVDTSTDNVERGHSLLGVVGASNRDPSVETDEDLRVVEKFGIEAAAAGNDRGTDGGVGTGCSSTHKMTSSMAVMVAFLRWIVAEGK